MIYVDEGTCDLCGACVVVCPVDSIRLHATELEIRTNCIDCQICIKVCPVDCLELGEPYYVKNGRL